MRRVGSSLLWGLVGVLSFLVAVQTYQLVVARLDVGLPALLGVALVVGGVVALAAYALEHRLLAKGRT